MEKKVEIFTVQFGNKDLYPEDKHKQAEEVEAVLVEAEEVNDSAVEELKDSEMSYKDKFEALMKEYGIEKLSDLDDDKKKEFFNTLDEVHTSEDEKAGDLEPEDKDDEELKNVEVNDSEVKVELEGEVNENLSVKEEGIVTEALRSIYKLLSKTSLNEEESVEVPEDAEAELEVRDDKVVITIDVDQAKEEVTEEEAEELKEAIDIIRYFIIK